MYGLNNETQITEQLIAEVRKLIGEGNTKKATFDTSTGLYGVSLEAPAKSLIPFLPSWVNQIPREVIATGKEHTYKRVLSMARTGKSTAAEGTKGSGVTITTDSVTAAFGNLSSGLFDVTYEEEVASKNYDDALAKATSYALLFGKRIETAHILGGTVSALGAPANITATEESNVAGTFAKSTTYYFNVKALNVPALQKAILSNVVVKPNTTQYHTITAIDAVVDQTDGMGIEGTQATVTPAGDNHSVKLTWDAVPGAVAYAVFCGTSSGIANLKCQGIVCQNYITIPTPTTGGSAGVSGDNSADANAFNGVLPLIIAGGCYKKNVGAALSSAVGNGIPEIDEMLSSCWSKAIGIDEGSLVMGSQDRAIVTAKLGSGASTTLYRMPIAVGADNTFAGGAFADYYIHPISGKRIPIVTDPNLYHGTIIWIPSTIPYPMAEVPAPLKMWLSFDWTQFAYAITAPKREYENRMRGGLACYIPTAFGMLYNIYNG
jgi:hypothetical protein